MCGYGLVPPYTKNAGVICAGTRRRENYLHTNLSHEGAEYQLFRSRRVKNIESFQTPSAPSSEFPCWEEGVRFADRVPVPWHSPAQLAWFDGSGIDFNACQMSDAVLARLLKDPNN